jgi:lipopolysaccharide assembly outer membrane protein LptD (OstA)
MRFTMASGYDFKASDRPVAPIRGELIIDPSRYFYFRADTSYGVYKDEGLQSANTDFGLTLPQFAATLGTRFTKGSSNFLQGTLRADLTRYMSASFATNWDVRSDTFVENRFGVDFRFQCWAFDFAYITRSREQGLNATDNEIRFAVYLLGIGGPFGVGQRFTAGAPGVTGR